MEWLIKNTDFCMAITSICSVIISLFAMFITIYTAVLQRKQNMLSLAPAVDVFSMNYRDEIGLEISNNGLGLLIVDKIVFTRKDGMQAYSLIDLMPDDIAWKNYLFTDNVFSIAPGTKVIILQLTSEDSKERTYARSKLREISIHIEYSDVYNNKSQFDVSLEYSYEDEKSQIQEVNLPV